MKIRSPEWHIKHDAYTCAAPCGECDGNPLLLIACPNCGGVVLICEQGGIVFTAHKNPDPTEEHSNMQLQNEDELCISCGDKRYSEFAPATGEQIQDAGFEAGKYV